MFFSFLPFPQVVQCILLGISSYWGSSLMGMRSLTEPRELFLLQVTKVIISDLLLLVLGEWIQLQTIVSFVAVLRFLLSQGR